MTDPLILAIPSKGRMRDDAMAFFTDCGLKVETGGGRGYSATLRNGPGVDVRLLSASDIAQSLLTGEAHLGLTGLDLIEEHCRSAPPLLLKPLGFGHADVVVATPAAWIDVSTMSDLEDVSAGYVRAHGRKFRVATKYINLTTRFFAEKGLADYRIVESLGATEAAPAAGAAEAIVDITSTGATLAANNLKILDDGLILRSEAHLAASMRAEWTESARAAARIILDRISARALGLDVKEIRYRTPKPNVALVERLVRDHGCAAPFGAETRSDLGEMLIHCPFERMYEVVKILQGEGAQIVVASTADYIFEADNPLYAKLEAQLDGAEPLT
ncbi:MAG: ATP phosphoribosyltransferase [Pseudomonadota bacterium]